MQVNISGRHLDVTAPLKEHVHAKLGKLVSHYPKISESSIDVSMSVDKKFQQCAKAHVNVNGKQVCATAVKADMYGAVNAMVNELLRQLHDHRGKITKH